MHGHAALVRDFESLYDTCHALDYTSWQKVRHILAHIAQLKTATIDNSQLQSLWSAAHGGEYTMIHYRVLRIWNVGYSLNLICKLANNTMEKERNSCYDSKTFENSDKNCTRMYISYPGSRYGPPLGNYSSHRSPRHGNRLWRMCNHGYNCTWRPYRRKGASCYGVALTPAGPNCSA